MKKIIIALLLLVASFVTFVSCQKEIVCASENEPEEELWYVVLLCGWFSCIWTVYNGIGS